MSSSSNAKARHYAALASRLRQLRDNVGETEVQFAAMTLQLESMRRFAAANAAQFMAVSRLLDVELNQDVVVAEQHAAHDVEAHASHAQQQ